jgi:hypothetical protein
LFILELKNCSIWQYIKKTDRNKLNTLKLIVLLLIGFFTAQAQTGYYKPFSFGLGYGVTIASAGEQTLTSANATEVNFNYHFTPFVSLSLAGQFGQLTGGDLTKDTYGKQFVNDYAAIFLHFDLQAGEFIDYEHSQFNNALKNLHVGIGMGFMANNITSINLFNPADSSTQTYLKNSPNFVVPLRIGYEFKIFNRYEEPQLRLDLNYSFNTAFGPGLDGYTSIYSHSFINFYNYFSVGLKYSFGPIRSYRKQIYYSNF